MLTAKQLLFQTTGKRLPWPHGKENKVKLYSFKNIDLIAGHVAMEIYHKGECYFISLMIDTHDTFLNRNILQLREGVSSFFVPSLDEECLFHGFNNSRPDIWQYVPLAFRDKSEVKLTVKETLEIIALLPAEQKKLIEKAGRPNNEITLYSLDTEKMITKAKEYRENPKAQWASFAGTAFHQKNTYNCASLVLEILYAGNMADLLVAERDIFSFIGALLGLTYTLTHCPSLMGAILGLVVGFIAGRFIGGAIEGYTNIQNLLNITATQSNDQLSTVLGLRVLSALLNSFGALIPGNPDFSSILTLPSNVFHLAAQAQRREDALYGPDPKRPSPRMLNLSH